MRSGRRTRPDRVSSGVQRGRPDGQLFWPAATVVAIYFFRNRVVDGSWVTLGTMMLPSVLATSVAFGMMIVIQALTSDREDGTLLRAKATPSGIPSYLAGKPVTTSLTVMVYLLMVAIPSSFLLEGLDASCPPAWLTAAWVVGLGMIATQLLGAVLGSIAGVKPTSC